MESKIDYHVLTMDEIVFDNRNKAYGAFAVRKVYEKNLLKAIILSAGIFCLAMSSPAILRNLGLLTEAGISAMEETIFTTGDFKIDVLPSNPVEIPKPSGPRPTSDYMVPVDKGELPTEPDPKQPDPSTTGTPTGPVINDPSGGTPSGGGNDPGDVKPTIVDINEILTGQIEVMPEYPGGDEAFREFVDENLPYPEQERIDEVEGVTKIEFVVNTDGSIEQVKVSKSSGYANFDAAALKLVKSIKKYKPGKQNGHTVRVRCVLPIGFELH